MKKKSTPSKKKNLQRKGKQKKQKRNKAIRSRDQQDNSSHKHDPGKDYENAFWSPYR